MEKIYLQGGTLQITEKNKVYQVEKGHVLVYLTRPLRDEDAD